jgi:hypothetical protein
VCIPAQTDLIKENGRNAIVAEITFIYGKKEYVPAAEGIALGQKIQQGKGAEIATGNVLFLQELPEVLEFCEADKLKPLVTKLFKRIVRCIAGSHLQVADRAMCLFESESFIQIIKQYKTLTFNMLVPVIVKLADNHWHKMLQESLTALKEILHKIDPTAFDNALENSETKKYDK